MSIGKHYNNCYITLLFRKSLSISFKSQLYRRLSLYNPLSYPLIFKANLIAFVIDLIILDNKDKKP
jgi:hypothetical protein